MTIRRGLVLLFAALFFAPVGILLIPLLPVILPVLLFVPGLVVSAIARAPRLPVRRAAQLASIPVSYTCVQAETPISA